MAQLLDGRWVLSPQDVVAEFECQHRVDLNAAALSGSLVFAQQVDPAMDLLFRQGLEHEQRRLNDLSPNLRVKRLGAAAHSSDAYRSAWQATLAAMDDEYDVIYQATLFTGNFVGIADFLLMARDSDGAVVRDARGVAIYEPVDAKSSRTAKRSAVLQVASYGDALIALGRPSPLRVHLWLAGENDWSGPAGPYMSLARRYRSQVAARLPQLGALPSPSWAAPREACVRCRFASLCEDGRLTDRDVSLVQGIRSSTRQRLLNSGICTIDELATASDEQRPAEVLAATFDRLRAQASIQVRGEGLDSPLVEVVDARELNALPERSLRDMWFDMEGDPYAPGPHGLEYMFGFGFLSQGVFDFRTFEAHSPAEEKRAFEDFIDEVLERRVLDPGMHVYHYANYEQRALKRLAQQYGTRETELDLLLKEGRFVDLYGVVQRGLRISTPSLSLKHVEAAYGLSHSEEDVSTAMDSVVQYEAFIALRSEGKNAEAEKILADIRSYNRLDCESTMKLDSWLRSLQTQYASQGRETVPQSAALEQSQPMDPHGSVIAELEKNLPVDQETRTCEEQDRALLAAALQYHPRERRPAWWQLFELIKAEQDELEHASNILLVHGGTAEPWEKSPRMKKHRRTMILDGRGVDPRLVLDGVDSAFLLYEQAPAGMAQPADSVRGYNASTVNSVNSASVAVTERAGWNDEVWHDLPMAVLPGPPFSTNPIRNAIARAASTVLPSANDGRWLFPNEVWADLLLARSPRTRSSGLPLSDDPVQDVCAALRDSDSSYVAVQGPPGTGKTYVGSRSVAQLALQGWRIGVVAQSHAVVDNFLEAVHRYDSTVALGKEPQGNQDATRPWHIGGKVQSWAMSQPHGFVMGGTAWTFSREAVRELNLDLLVIDEAGQFALADALACALAAQTVLLLGDPQQLPQVSQASHPEAIEHSVLEHVADGHATMPLDRGYFLDHTYRMHPALTQVVSHLQYEDKLKAAPVTSLRRLANVQPGIKPVSVEHSGNVTSSEEETRAVVECIRDLLGTAWTDVRDDHQLSPRPLECSDIIVVAAYNAQVRMIRRYLDDAGLTATQVGTVDKFQGKEAPIVIVSMAASSADEIPRGLDFLLSPNRLNVAISRAQWSSYIMFSPQLLSAQPSSIAGLENLGKFIEILAVEPSTTNESTS